MVTFDPARERVEIYLDVDGVLCPYALDTPPDWGWGATSRTCHAGALQVRYAPALVARLNALTGRDAVAAYWLTSWEEEAPQLLSPAIALDGRQWPVLGTDGRYSQELGGTWWKLAVLRDHLAAHGRPARAVWVDDDLATDPEAQEWAAAQADWLLTISPLTHRGLTRSDLERAEAWLTGTRVGRR